MMINRSTRQELPTWLLGLQEKLGQPLQYDLVAEDALYAEEGFSYVVKDRKEIPPPDVESEKSTFHWPAIFTKLKETFTTKQQNTPENIAIPLVEVTGKAMIPPFPHPLQENSNIPGTSHLHYVMPDEPVVRAKEVLVLKGDNGQPIYTPAFHRLIAWAAYQELLEGHDSLSRYLYASLLAAVLLLGFFYGLQALSAEACTNASRMSLCATCIVLHLILLWLSCFCCRKTGLGANFFLYALVPGSLAPALASHLLGRRTALCLSLLLSSISPVLVPTATPFQFFLTILALSLAGTIAYQNIQRRVQFLYCDLGIWTLGMCIALFFVLLQGLHTPWSNGAQKFWGTLVMLTGVNAVAVLLGTLLLPPMLEWIFDVYTGFTLNELNNNHRYLDQLKKEASGTFDHSKNVADIAEAEARAIGDDPKLAEVCGKFHDIGKLCDPGKFTENQGDSGENPHDRITPLESCAILREHVRYGYELACKEHLPRPVREVIAQHHGDGVMAFFYEKARREAAAAGQPDPPKAPYSYDVPRPTSRMVLLIEMADICEAAMRAKIPAWLKQGTPVTKELIRQTVEELIQGKIKEQQFDCADITIPQLRLATESVVNSLCYIHHVRTEYPSKGDATDTTVSTKAANGN